jgi:hypothetical protein
MDQLLTHILKPKLIGILGLLLLVMCCVAAIIVRPSIYSDPSWGLLTMKSMLHGAPFNYSTAPNPADISQNATGFNGVWTPGQYIIPFWLIKIFKMNLGWSLITTTVLMSLSGLVGYFKLFKYLQLPKNICLASTLIIVLQRFFSFPFSIYNGGEIMLFGGLPWIILISLKMRALRYWQVPLLILIGLLGFFLKSSFLISFYGICLCIFCLNFRKYQFQNYLIANLAKLIFIGLVTTWICYSFFISKGIYNSQSNDFQFNFKETVFTLSSTMASALSLDDIFKRVFEFPGNSFSDQANYLLHLIYYGIITIASVALIKYLIKRRKLTLYKTTFFSFLLSFLVIFLYFYNKENPTSSLEMRHFRPLGILAIPAIVLAATDLGKYLKITLCLFLFISCLYGPLSFIQRKFATYKHGTNSRQGFTHELIDAPSLAFIYKADKSADHNTVFYVTSPDIALEINNARVIATQADFEVIEDLKKRKYRGTVNRVYILLPNYFEDNGKAGVIVSSFVNYKKVIKSKLSDEYNLYTLSEKQNQVE